MSLILLELPPSFALALASTILLVGAAAAALCGPRLAWVVGVGAGLSAAGAAMLGAVRGLGASSAPDDGVSVWCAALVMALGALVLIAAVPAREGDRRSHSFAIAATLVAIAAWAGAAMASDFVTLFTATQAAWLAGVGLIGISAARERRGLTGALRMLTQGGVAAGFMLLGVGLLARSFGSMDLAALPVAAPASPLMAAAGIMLVVVSLVLKAGLAPLNMWIGPALGGANSSAAIAIGVIGVTGALGLLIKVAAYGMAAPAIAPGLSLALLGLGLTSVALGSLQALGASDLRRLAGYAGVAQAGCIVICVGLGSPAGYAAALVQLLAMSAAALALFSGAAAISGPAPLDAADGLARRAPLAAAAIASGAVSLMGAPLTLGFLGRWRFIEAGVGGGWWWTAGAAIAASLAAVVYGGRLIERVYFRRAAAPSQPRSAWRFALAPALLAAIVAVALGLAPGRILTAADVAARSIGASP